jgi:FMN reductase
MEKLMTLSTNIPVRVVGIGGTLRAGSNSLNALAYALDAAQAAGATTELIDLNQADLPLYRPSTALHDYPPQVARFIDQIGQADAMIWSTAVYHGSLAGATKNAIDFFEFLARDESPYLHNRPVGLIATAGGDQGGIYTIQTMVNMVHSLRGTALPLSVPIAKARNLFTADGELTDHRIAERLTMLGELTVETARRFKGYEMLALA